MAWLVLLWAGPAAGQTGAGREAATHGKAARSEAEALGRELFRATNGAGDLEDAVRDMLQQGYPDEPPELWDAVLRSLDLDGIEAQVGKMYASRLTPDEMRQAIAFYRTPAGQKLISVQPEILNQVFEDTGLLEQVFAGIEKALASGEVRTGPTAESHQLMVTVRTLRDVGTAMMSWLTDRVEASDYQFLPEREDSGSWAFRKEGADEKSLRRISHGELRAVLVPDYLDELPATDGWGHPLEFAVNADLLEHSVLGVRSPGSDGEFETDSYVVGPFPTEDVHRDVAWSDGYFVCWPE